MLKSLQGIFQELKTAFVNTINVYDILKYEKFIITKDAVLKRLRRCTHNENSRRYN